MTKHFPYRGALVACLLGVPLILPLKGVRAEDCRTIRLDAPGFSMEHVPVTYQGHVGICYAHAAAQMLDAYRFSHPSSVPHPDFSFLSSPLEIAAGHYHDGNAQEDFDDGAYNICPSIRYVQKYGSCSEDVVNSLYSAPGFERSDFTDLFRKYQSDYRAIVKKLGPSATADMIQKALLPATEQFESDLSHMAELPASRMLPNSETLLNEVASQSFTNGVYNFLEPMCSSEYRVPAPAGIRCTDQDITGQQALDEIHSLLGKPNPQPVAIKMCRNLFEEGHTYRGVRDGGFTPDCQIHWPLVIGQKRVNGKCYLLVRNSFGTNDSGYSSDWITDHGNLWIEENALIRNTLEVSYLR